MSPPMFTLPASFVVADSLPWTLRNRREDACWFVSTVMRKMAHRDIDRQGLVRLKMEYLRSTMNFDDASAVVNALVESKTVERFPYRPKDHAYGYRLGAKFVTDKHVRVPITDKRLIARIEKNREKRHAERTGQFEPVHRELESRQQHLRIDADDARQALTELSPDANRFDSQSIVVGDIERHWWRFSVGRTGRVSHSFSSLKRELRRYLHVNGQRLGHADIRNSQLTILGYLATSSAQDTTDTTSQPAPTTRTKPLMMWNADCLSYHSACQEGVLYDKLLAELSTTKLTRDAVKTRVLADVIAKRGNYPSEVEDAFKRLFPSIHAYVRQANRDDYRTLIRQLQMLEADLVIRGVAGDLVRRFPGLWIAPLHDSIFAKADDLATVEQGFQKAFKRYKMPMALKIVEA